MLRSDKVNMVISVIIALVLWGYVIMEINPTITQKYTGVPVRLLNTETVASEGLSIVGDPSYMVEVILEGRRVDLLNLSKDELSATANLAGYGAGDNTVPVQMVVPDGIKIKEIRNRSLLIRLEEEVGKIVPVDIIFDGTFPVNTEAGNMSISPSQVEVRGAQSTVEKLNSLEVVIPVDKVKKDPVSYKGEVVPKDIDGNKIQWLSLSSEIVEVQATLLSVKEVLLIMDFQGDLPPNLTMVESSLPSKVVIKGKSTLLEGIDALAADPVDISRLTPGSIKLPLGFQLPVGIELSEKSKNLVVSITVVQGETRELVLPSEAIEVRGLKEGYSAVVSPQNVVVNYLGSKEALDQLNPENLQVYVDATNFEEGSYTMPIHTYTVIKIDRAIVLPKEIKVTISKTT